MPRPGLSRKFNAEAQRLVGLSCRTSTTERLFLNAKRTKNAKRAKEIGCAFGAAQRSDGWGMICDISADDAPKAQS